MFVAHLCLSRKRRWPPPRQVAFEAIRGSYFTIQLYPKIRGLVILLSLVGKAPALLIGSYIHQGITRTSPAALALLQNSVFHQFPNIAQGGIG